GGPIQMAPHPSLMAALLPKDFPALPRRRMGGVVPDIREEGVDRPAAPVVYVPYAQSLPPNEDASESFFLVVRSSNDPTAQQRAVEDALRQVDKNVPISGVRTLSRGMDESLARRRFAMLLLTSLGAIALMLVVAGVYGVMAYIVSQHEREFGIRLALGATRRDVTMR